jgi:hypothetical protein
MAKRSNRNRWRGFSSVHVNPDELNFAIMDILEEYGDLVYEATEEGLDVAEKVLVKNLKAATPVRTGEFKKGWKGTGRKYKLLRFVGNTVTVKGGDTAPSKKGRKRIYSSNEIALANIFEYSILRGRPFIKKTFKESIDEMAAAVVAEIKKI